MALPAKIPARILEALKDGRAMTTEQLCAASGVHRTTVSGPARELQHKGLITITQKYVSSGNLMNVFQIAGGSGDVFQIAGGSGDVFNHRTVTDYAKTQAPQQSWFSSLGAV